MHGIQYLVALVAFLVSATLQDLSAAAAMPFQRLQATTIVPVASGCGLGVRRGPFDRCDPYHYIGYRSSSLYAYYIGPVCGRVCCERISHLPYNSYGSCLIGCN